MLIFVFSSILTSKEKNKNFIKLIYFHPEHRCQSCLEVEKKINNVLLKSFKDEIKKNKLNLEKINFDDEQNLHFMKDFDIDSQTLIIIRYIDGKQKDWKKLEGIWDFMNNNQKFNDYLINEIKDFTNLSN